VIATESALSPENEETYLRLLTISDFAEGHALLFARCNSPAFRNQLADRLSADLAARGFQIYTIEVTEPTSIVNLIERIRVTLPTESEQSLEKEALLFLLGLENALPFNDSTATLLAELNMGRELLQKAAPLPILFWLPDYAITAIARYALDFWSWRSGVFEFEAEATHHAESHAQFVEQNSDWLSISNLSVEQKQRRLRVLEGLLHDYEQAVSRSPKKTPNSTLMQDSESDSDFPRITEQMRAELFEQLAQLYYSLGEVEKAIGYYEQALAIAREIGHKQGEGADLGNLGNAYRNLGEVEKAIGYYEQALAIAREIGHKQGEGADLGNLGLAYADLGEVEKAHTLWQQSLAIFEAIKSPSAETVRGWLAKLE